MGARGTASVFVMSLALVTPACDSDLASCDEVADEAVGLVQGVVDAADAMSLADMRAQEGPPDYVQRLDEQGERLEQAAVELDCTDQELRDLIAERAEQLDSNGPVGEMVIEAVRGGQVFG